MRIAIITVETLKDFPPIVTMLKELLAMKHQVTCMTPAKDILLDGIPEIKQCFIRNTPIQYQEKHPAPHLVASIAFRADKWTKKLCLRRLVRKYRSTLQTADVVWVAHEDTALLGGKRLIRALPEYIYTMYELPLKIRNNKRIYEYAARRAKVLVAPEYCRAHIMKAIYERNTLPLVIPNKPFAHPRQRMMEISDQEAKARIAAIEESGRKIIMYMGIISNERPLEPVIQAVSKIRDRYELVVLGPWTEYLEWIQSRYGECFTYLGSFEPPYHLEIASHAHIAYITYIPRNKSINAVFCAPNKVYEFAGFGIPLLCNDVPGLKYLVEPFGMGVCLNETSEICITSAIAQIEENYQQIQSSALQFYESEDIRTKFSEAIRLSTK